MNQAILSENILAFSNKSRPRPIFIYIYIYIYKEKKIHLIVEMDFTKVKN